LQEARTAGRSGGDGVSWQTEEAAAASDCSGNAGMVDAAPGCAWEAPADGKISDGSRDAGSGSAGDATAACRRRRVAESRRMTVQWRRRIVVATVCASSVLQQRV
jgi:hypothetical protein